MTSLTNSNLELKNMFGQFMKMNTAFSSGLETLPSNTITNPKEDLKGITTRSGIAYKGPTIPTTTSPPKVVECETEVTKDTVTHTNNESTKDVQPSVVQVETQILNYEPVVAPVVEPVEALNTIPFLSRLQISFRASIRFDNFHLVGGNDPGRLFGGSLGDKIIRDLDKTPNLSQRSPQNCPKCGNPVNGHYCQRCALLRKKYKEDLFTYCIKNGILQDFFEPSYDNTKIVNALREPFVVTQDPSKNSSQSPPQINHHCCYECGDPLEDIFCHQYTCELCGRGAHYPPKVPVVPDPEPFNNQTVDELPQTRPSFDTTCYSEDGNSFTYDSTSNLV
nr:reverse transcriptase domain-containing protein [Tanacetum cinerariifolium]